MRVISMEEAGQVAGGEGEVCVCPLPDPVVQPALPDGSFSGFLGEVLRDFSGFLQSFGDSPTALPANNAELGFRG